jgi:hypothetical protein
LRKCSRYGVLKNYGRIIMVCEYNGSVVNVYGDLESCGSVIVVCEYDRIVVDVYGDE